MDKKKSLGFSLIELMIVVAIIGIVMAIAIPGYDAYRVRSSRAAAQALLLEVYAKQESFAQKERMYSSVGGVYGNGRGFVTAVQVIEDLLGAGSVPADVLRQYVLTIPKVDVAAMAGAGGATLASFEGYELRATPAPGSRQAGAGEGILVINQFGLKTIRKNDGSDAVQSFW